MSGSNARRIRTWAATLVAVTGAAAMPANADTVYVNGDCGDDAWTGTTPVCQAPDGPKATIQAGIDAAKPGDLVLIADGVYTGPDNKNLDFGGKAITVRGENGRDNCLIDCEQDGRAFYFHSGEGPDSVVEGLTIRDGRALFGDPISENGAGILCVGSRPTIKKCTLTQCFAGNAGGGVYLDRGSDAIIRGCTFSGNNAISGGGMAIIGASPLVKDCAFIRNRSSSAGAGSAIFSFAELTPPQIIACYFDGNSDTSALYAAGSAVVVRGCFFTGNDTDYAPAIGDYSTNGAWIDGCRFMANRALYSPGAVHCTSRTVLLNCQFYDNASGIEAGGAITVHDGTTVRNCSFAGNVARSGGGGAVYADGSASSFENCVFWNNDPEPITFRNDSPVITYSLVEGGWPGEGNIDLDPLFVDPANGDFRLSADSPCIDSGDPAIQPPGGRDLDGNMRVWNGRVDMGAYEFGSHPFGDTNCDGAINALDIEPFLVALFEPESYAGQYPNCDINLADINIDGSIDALDIEGFLGLLFP